jgi:signal transduction histidine kinase
MERTGRLMTHRMFGSSDAPPALSRCLKEIMGFVGEAAQLSKQMLAYAGRRSLAIRALDPNTELSLALPNLLLNALDALERDARGTVSLITRSVRRDAERGEFYGIPAGDYVRVTVRDTGAGIVPEARERLFEPFFSTKGAGRGRGLAAAVGTVRAHRGWLGVEETSRWLEH